MAEAVDKHRANYIISHIQQVQRACREGVDVMGYLYWSIVDNYEWAYQYEARARFGLFHINRTTLETPAGSFPGTRTSTPHLKTSQLQVRQAHKPDTALLFPAVGVPR
ncbi:MAG TPA: family 1 glycosylhydrolase [Candidatus Saccharimonadia bacterium]|nr:family 1 glycosylhydrolase [Candidatus Saccharimonadia bacterium]